MHSGVLEKIQNQRNLFENNVSKACILMVFKTIWNCREHFENNVSKACILVYILVVFETIWNCLNNMKTMYTYHLLKQTTIAECISHIIAYQCSRRSLMTSFTYT